MYRDDEDGRAWMYGRPPAGGEGLGIERLVMRLADVPSNKDVIVCHH